MFIDRIRGKVLLKKKSESTFNLIQQKTAVGTGDSIRTEGGLCEIGFENETGISVAPNSTLSITDAAFDSLNKTRTTLLKLDQGRLRAKIGKLGKGSKFEVATPTAIAVVRGTVLYINTGAGENQQPFTELFVDESDKGVQFTNTQSGNEFLVQEDQSSSSFGDGSILAPQELSQPEQQQFVENWKSQANEAAKLGEVEEEQNPPQENPVTPEVSQEETIETNDAKDDKKSEQNISGAALFGQPAPQEQVPEPLEQWSYDSVKYDEANKPLTGATLLGRGDLGDVAGNREEERRQLRAAIRTEIERIREDLDFEHRDAQFEQTLDAQTGKVFTDALGNRVRVDEYIFQPDPSSVELLSLTLRAGSYQPGISSLAVEVNFNTAIDRPLRELPWNDYLNVVKGDDLDAQLEFEQFLTNNYEALGEADDENDGESIEDNELIVHQGSQRTVGADEDARMMLYPVNFQAAFSNPAGDRIKFGESYSEPVNVQLRKIADDSTVDLWVQGKTTESTLIQPLAGDKIFVFRDTLTDQETISINDGTPQNFVCNQNQNNGGDGGSQTAAFAANFDPSKLLDVNVYRTMPENNDGNPDNDEHPSYFDDKLNNRLDANNAMIGRNRLIGAFIPINDQGKIIDQPGFKVRGLRDILNPNPLVNGGNYNFEIILMYGYTDNSGQSQGNLFQEGIFYEDFRIDTIITPEIFQPSSALQNNTPSLFPAALYADNDDTRSSVVIP